MNASDDCPSPTDSSLPTPFVWPQQMFPLSEVQAWIGSVLGYDASITVTPIALYAAYTEPPDLRLTARLAIRQGQGAVREVVFKANRFPLLPASARAHALVSRHANGMVPHILAWEEDSDSSSRLLYQPFAGQSVGDISHSGPLIETARTLARIQNAVTASQEAEGAGIPCIRATDIPTLYEAVYSHIQSCQEAWRTDADGKLSKWLGFPGSEILDVLDAVRPLVIRCVEVVAALELPVTIDHGDLHGGNAVIQENGTILIYDWETASVGCPLFSMEKLIVSAWSRDENPEGCGPWGYVPGTPTQAPVRDAYLHALGRADISASTFAAAMCLATIKEMHAEIAWAKLMHWSDGNPEWTAQLVSRMRYHLQAMQ